MKPRHWAWLLAIGCLGRTPLELAQGTDAMVIVVNKANTGAAGMSLGDARKLLLGETSEWRSGAKVVVVLKPAGSPDRAAVLKRICGMTESAYTRYQMQASFTGQTAATVTVAPSNVAVKASIKSNPGAIGFLPKAEADDSVKVVLTLD